MNADMEFRQQYSHITRPREALAYLIHVVYDTLHQRWNAALSASFVCQFKFVFKSILNVR